MEHGFDDESPEEVAAATIVGSTDGSLTVIQGSETTAQTIELIASAGPRTVDISARLRQGDATATSVPRW